MVIAPPEAQLDPALEELPGTEGGRLQPGRLDLWFVGIKLRAWVNAERVGNLNPVQAPGVGCVADHGLSSRAWRRPALRDREAPWHGRHPLGTDKWRRQSQHRLQRWMWGSRTRAEGRRSQAGINRRLCIEFSLSFEVTGEDVAAQLLKALPGPDYLILAHRSGEIGNQAKHNNRLRGQEILQRGIH